MHDWLYTYIYKDMYEIVIPKNRHAAKATVFFVSAVAHDYILWMAFDFFMPVLFILFFCIGYPMSYIDIKYRLLGNSLFIYTFAVGINIIVSCYVMEHFARFNKGVESRTWSDFFTLHSFS